ncbi:hypothetical protein ZWY2020_007445 [Hordeum vulgare]|nr:hypothetical protein ZWY2020_007445 [Hordeum vulgare]
MAIKRGFSDEDKEEMTQMSDAMNLKEATLADKITKEALSKVMAHGSQGSLGPDSCPADRDSSLPCPGERHRPDPYPQNCPDLRPGPSHPLNLV